MRKMNNIDGPYKDIDGYTNDCFMAEVKYAFKKGIRDYSSIYSSFESRIWFPNICTSDLGLIVDNDICW